MNLKVRIALDALCWTGTAVALTYVDVWLAGLVGAIGIFYIYRAMVWMLRITKMEQEIMAHLPTHREGH